MFEAKEHAKTAQYVVSIMFWSCDLANSTSLSSGFLWKSVFILRNIWPIESIESIESSDVL